MRMTLLSAVALFCDSSRTVFEMQLLRLAPTNSGQVRMRHRQANYAKC
jgi:hypothetical protein